MSVDQKQNMKRREWETKPDVEWRVKWAFYGFIFPLLLDTLTYHIISRVFSSLSSQKKIFKAIFMRFRSNETYSAHGSKLTFAGGRICMRRLVTSSINFDSVSIEAFWDTHQMIKNRFGSTTTTNNNNNNRNKNHWLELWRVPVSFSYFTFICIWWVSVQQHSNWLQPLVPSQTQKQMMYRFFKMLKLCAIWSSFLCALNTMFQSFLNVKLCVRSTKWRNKKNNASDVAKLKQIT